MTSAPSSAPSGAVPTVVRGPSAKTLLKLSWDYPVWVAPEVDSAGRTVAAKQRAALPLDEALAYIAGKDPRPLLVLRECQNCNGTDDALLSRESVDNERTFLLTRWFHCVKLPVDVLQPSHPFHALFPGDDPEHMFFSSADGSLRVPFESETSRVELWGAMSQVLKATYAKEPEGQVRKMERVIDDFDLIDQKVGALEQEVDSILESEGPESKKLKKAKQELEKAVAQRTELFAAIDQATAELKLKKLAGEPTAPKGS